MCTTAEDPRLYAHLDQLKTDLKSNIFAPTEWASLLSPKSSKFTDGDRFHGACCMTRDRQPRPDTSDLTEAFFDTSDICAYSSHATGRARS